ncbi:LacI family DNA-binding transcriptional regulator [Herbiconiux moechotypicola]|uniref:LacI family DNA-binding transcriptional regulator n=2 Tax=Herbiconiux moechotypicola TaxID=637393 RepID=A0ABN3DQ10_9MICO
MKDVAALAGVGVKTVSRVVNGERYVSEETRTAVERAIVQLRFQRNTGAASLRHGSSATIGLIVEDIAEPFQSNFARAVEGLAIANGTLLFTASSSDNIDREREMALSLIARRVDGLIVIPSPFDHGFLQPELAAGLPIVFADRPPLGLVADSVTSDNRGGARAAVTHLIEQGCRRVVYIGDGEDIYTGAERLAGYRDALADADIPLDSDLVFLGHPDSARSEAALRTSFTGATQPTGLFTGNTLNTIATLRTAAYAEFLPAHVAFDDFELADLMARPLTVVAQDPAEMGRRAAGLLFDRLENGPGPHETVTLPTRLILRDSSRTAR